jgi:mutator protein MutT
MTAGQPPMSSTMITVAAAVIERDGRYLITQRRDDAPFGGHWEFPGGKCRPGESLTDCLHREVREEVDIAVKVLGLEERIADVPGDRGVELHFYRCAWVSGEPQPLGCQALQWVRPEELVDYRFPPANRPLIARLSRRVSSR